ncbi:HAD family acid phosphatase [Nannocystis sp. ncelm1]|uniref:HAD family acid phosphatase n=2 Tax=Nannocystis radixulma TaxID=2995305 RepID=A0ABT5BFI4_9BACT|nr:HAD family acid phosphatase [Nannocystis radixulma]MDC0672905.1 HAD family acid phosphatase [Nannocystis radixulma]
MAAPAGGCAGTTAELAHDNMNAVLWMQTAAEYEALALQAYAAAMRAVEVGLADPTIDALPKGERRGDPAALAPAVIVDIDETVLDNSPFQARLVYERAGYSASAWHAWGEERAARAVPGAVAFARAAADRGVTVFYVTNRDRSLYAATRANLAAQGFPLAESVETLLPLDSQRGWTEEKGRRRALIGERYRVLALIGDTLGDFMDGADATIPARSELIATYLEFWGERWIVLPNPSYGSWESALMRPAGPSEAAAAGKRGALRLR